MGGATGQFAFFHGQALAQAGDRLVRSPAVADKALVQVDVAIDKAWQHHQAFEVDRFAGCSAGALRADVGDAPVGYGNVQRHAIGVDGVDELTVVHDRAFSNEAWVTYHGRGMPIGLQLIIRIGCSAFMDAGQGSLACIKKPTDIDADN